MIEIMVSAYSLRDYVVNDPGGKCPDLVLGAYIRFCHDAGHEREPTAESNETIH